MNEQNIVIEQSATVPAAAIPQVQASGRLIAHRGAKIVDRAKLRDLPPVEGTDSWNPIPHIELVETLTKEFNFNGWNVEQEQFAIQKQDNLLFGVFKLSRRSEGGDYQGAFGFRTSNDKTLALRAVAGVSVFVCDNLALAGDQIVLKRKHTKNLDLRWEVHTAFDRFQASYARFGYNVETMKKLPLKDEDAKLLIYNAVKNRVVPLKLFGTIDQEYFEPSCDWGTHSLWRLNNAFTFACRDLNPAPKMDHLSKVGQYFNELIPQFQQAI